MGLILFDEPNLRTSLKPVTLTRPIAEIRIGIFKISEKWRLYTGMEVSCLTESYLSTIFKPSYSDDNIYVNASILPDKELVKAIISLEIETVLLTNNELIACRTIKRLDFGFEIKNIKVAVYHETTLCIKQLPDLFLKNAQSINSDFDNLIDKTKSSKFTDKNVVTYNEPNIYIGKNVKIKACILNAEDGPIYIADDAIIQEGSIIIGPVSIGENSMVAFGAKIRPNTSIGPFSRVGGEVGNSIFQGFSNKAHDGFLGNSYIGEWCNLGANTNNSNLKNDYKSVKLHNYLTDTLEDTDELFCGTFMGDYTKTGISTMLNTGTVLGVSCNVYGAGFQEKYVPSFSWGGAAEQYSEYRFDKAIEVINATMERKSMRLSEPMIEILKKIFEEKK